MAVADHFTKGNVEGGGLTGMRYDAGDGTNGPPLLRDRGVQYILRCRLLDEEAEGGLVRVRDHMLVVGEVVRVVRGEGEASPEFGLAYADRKYREVGAVISGDGKSGV